MKIFCALTVIFALAWLLLRQAAADLHSTVTPRHIDLLMLTLTGYFAIVMRAHGKGKKA